MKKAQTAKRESRFVTRSKSYVQKDAIGEEETIMAGNHNREKRGRVNEKRRGFPKKTR